MSLFEKRIEAQKQRARGKKARRVPDFLNATDLLSVVTKEDELWLGTAQEQCDEVRCHLLLWEAAASAVPRARNPIVVTLLSIAQAAVGVWAEAPWAACRLAARSWAWACALAAGTTSRRSRGRMATPAYGSSLLWQLPPVAAASYGNSRLKGVHYYYYYYYYTMGANRKLKEMRTQKEQYGAAAALLIRKHKRDQKKRGMVPYLMVEDLKEKGLLTPLGTSDSKQVLVARRQTLQREFDDTKSELRTTFHAIAHGNLSMRCFEYEAALKDCDAALRSCE